MVSGGGKIPLVAVVAGSDPSTGAGLQADLRTLEKLGVAAATVVSAVTVQAGAAVAEVEPVPARLIKAQFAEVLKRLPVTAVKTGLLPLPESVSVLAGLLRGRRLPLVVDPVLEAGAGGRLAAPGVDEALAAELFPLARVVTVNLAEAEVFAGFKVDSSQAMAEAARTIGRLGPKAVVVKGGHLPGDPVDLLWDGQRMLRMRGSRIGKAQMHGSGCAYASALAAVLAWGGNLQDAVRRARRHVRWLIASAQPLGGRLMRRPPFPQTKVD